MLRSTHCPAFHEETLPVRFLNRISKSFKNLWRKVDEFRSAHEGEWDGRVFMPLDGWREQLVRNFPEITPEKHHQAMLSCSAAGAWRPGQDIVRFDPDFQNMLCKTRITGAIPCDCLMRLPAWCIYFDTGLMTFNGATVEGFFAFLEENETRDVFYLRLMFLGERICQPVLLPLGEWTLERSLELAHVIVNQNRILNNLPIEAESPHVDEGLYAALNMILFVCSQAMERGDSSSFSNPAPKKVKKGGWRIFPPAKPNIHVLGKAAGEKFRQYVASEREKRGVAPHIRKAHWHGFWHGPLKGVRDFRLRWLSPIPVNMREEAAEERIAG